VSLTEKHTTLFEKISIQLELGLILTEPTALSGGLLHQMFQLQTTSGTYAIKLLNPSILSRPKARQNFIDSERIATALQHEALLSLPFRFTVPPCNILRHTTISSFAGSTPSC